MRGETLNSQEGLGHISRLALQHIEPPREDMGSVVWWRGSGVLDEKKNAAAALVTYPRRASIPADEKENEINE